MSMNLILTSYSDLGQGKYSDCDSKNLESVELTDDFLLGNVDSHVADIDIWDTQEGPPYQQKAVKTTEIRQILGGCEKTAKDIMAEILKDNISAKQQDFCFDKITMILDARNLLRKKITKYANQDNIFVIVG